MSEHDPYTLALSATARRQLTHRLPEPVAIAAWEFMTGPLVDNPQGVGKRLLPPQDDQHSARRGTYRILYRIDEKNRVIEVVTVLHRRDAYRT